MLHIAGLRIVLIEAKVYLWDISREGYLWTNVNSDRNQVKN